MDLEYSCSHSNAIELRNKLINYSLTLFHFLPTTKEISEKKRAKSSGATRRAGFKKMAENIADISVFIGIFTNVSGNFPIFPTSPARAQDTKSVQLFYLQAKVVFFSLAQKSWI